ncbi:MAG TPA: hypothetical protein VFD32_04030 [Dehalococcoidia bacterium]|nr:hypothetical protein [Dehalococcoidia bacterium]
MITHPTVLKIDAEAQQFAARHRPAATPERDLPADAQRRHGMPRTFIAGLLSIALRAARRPRPAVTPR